MVSSLVAEAGHKSVAGSTLVPSPNQATCLNGNIQVVTLTGEYRVSDDDDDDDDDE